MRKRVLKGLACAVWAAPGAVCTNDPLDAYRQAQTNYYDALRSYHQSRYDYLSNSLTLKQLAGRLSEADLGAIDGFLTRGRGADTSSAVSVGLSADTVRSETNK